jgi:hypothetical protein
MYVGGSISKLQIDVGYYIFEHIWMRPLWLSPLDGSISPVAIDIRHGTIDVNKSQTAFARWRHLLVSVQHSSSARLCNFRGQNVWIQRLIIKKCFPSTVRSVCHVKLFTIGCRSSLKGGHLSKTNTASAGHRRWSEIATEANVQLVEDLIRADRRVTIDQCCPTFLCTLAPHKTAGKSMGPLPNAYSLHRKKRKKSQNGVLCATVGIKGVKLCGSAKSVVLLFI